MQDSKMLCFFNPKEAMEEDRNMCQSETIVSLSGVHFNQFTPTTGLLREAGRILRCKRRLHKNPIRWKFMFVYTERTISIKIQ
jgi:hypothetical protein